MGIFPGFTADEFGQRNNTVNYGILFFGFALSGMLGPQVASWVMSGTGSYRSAFLIAAVVALAGFALTFLHRGWPPALKWPLAATTAARIPVPLYGRARLSGCAKKNVLPQSWSTAAGRFIFPVE